MLGNEDTTGHGGARFGSVAAIWAAWGFGVEGCLQWAAALGSDEVVPVRLARLGSGLRVALAFLLVGAILHGMRLVFRRPSASLTRVHLAAALFAIWLACALGPLSGEHRLAIVETTEFFTLRAPRAIVGLVACAAALLVGGHLLRSRRVGRRLAWAIAAFGLLGVAPGPTVRAESEKRPNIILLSVDTLRADHLGCYGYADGTSPHLDSLAKESVVFDFAFAAAPRTGPSYSTVLTASQPLRHKVYSNLNRLDESFLTVAERLQAEGYVTAALLKGAWPSTFINLDQGFDYVFHRGIPMFRPARTLDDAIEALWNAARSIVEERYALESSAMTDSATAFIRARSQAGPLFLHVYWNEPHDPYEPPASFVRPVGDETKSDPRHALYDGEIRFFDSQIGRVVDCLREEGLLRDGWVVFMGDHGEELGREKEGRVWWGHSKIVLDSSVHVPLMIRAPDSEKIAPARVPEVSMLVDVGATILDLASADATDTDGVSFVDVVRGEARPGPIAFSMGLGYGGETQSRWTARTQDWRYVEIWDGDRLLHRQLYSHADGNHEENDDVIGAHPAVADEIAKALQDWREGRRSR